MNRQQSQLWQRIESFEIDDPAASFPFSARLARENGWTREFALRVVDEYKRFVFLMVVAGHPVTPSDEVDQAWHLHLVYTRSYWEELCGEVLNRAVHHGPTKGGHAEGERFEDQYLKTLASYQEYFGECPPSDIWPPCEVRFAVEDNFVRVNAARHWIVDKRMLIGTAASIGAAGTAVFLTGAGPVDRGFSDTLSGVLVAAVAVGAFLAILYAMTRIHISEKKRRSRGAEGCGGFFGFFGCSADGDNHGGDSGCSASGCGNSGCSASGCSGGGGGCGGGGCGSS
jgi:hypothetical protein